MTSSLSLLVVSLCSTTPSRAQPLWARVTSCTVRWGGRESIAQRLNRSSPIDLLRLCHNMLGKSQTVFRLCRGGPGLVGHCSKAGLSGLHPTTEEWGLPPFLYNIYNYIYIYI